MSQLKNCMFAVKNRYSISCCAKDGIWFTKTPPRFCLLILAVDATSIKEIQPQRMMRHGVTEGWTYCQLAQKLLDSTFTFIPVWLDATEGN